MRDYVIAEVATKADLQNLAAKADLSQLEIRVTRRIGVMLGAAIGILAAIIKLT